MIQMKNSNALIIAMLVSLIAMAGIVCLADEKAAASPNSGEELVADANMFLEETIGTNIVSIKYTDDGVIEVIADPAFVSELSANTAEMKGLAYDIITKYDSFVLDGVSYMEGGIPDPSASATGALCIAGIAINNICSATPGLVTVYASESFTVTKTGYEEYDGSVVVKIPLDQKSIDFARYATNFVQIDVYDGEICAAAIVPAASGDVTLRELATLYSTLTADKVFDPQYASMINTLADIANRLPNAISSVSFVWNSNKTDYSLTLSDFEPGEGADAYQKLAKGIVNGIGDALPGTVNAWDVPLSEFYDPSTGEFNVSGQAHADYYAGYGTVVPFTVNFDAYIINAEDSAAAFVADMNSVFESSVGLDAAYGVYENGQIKFYVYPQNIPANVDWNDPSMAQFIIDSYVKYVMGGVTYIQDGDIPDVDAAINGLLRDGVNAIGNISVAEPGMALAYFADVNIIKSQCAPYDGAIFVYVDVDQAMIDAAEKISSVVSVDDKTGKISVSVPLYGIDGEMTAEYLAMLYSQVNAVQLFGEKYGNALNKVLEPLLNVPELFNILSIVCDKDGVSYKIALRNFQPGDGADAFQKIMAGIYNSMDKSPEGYTSGWDVPMSTFFNPETGEFEASGSIVISGGGMDINIGVIGKVDPQERPYDLVIESPEHATIIAVPGIDPTRVAFVVIPENGYAVDSVIINMGGVTYDITDTMVIELTDDAVVTAEVSPVLVPVEGVTLDKTSITIYVGTSAVLKATVLPANATNKNVMWSSSNLNAVSVNNGVVVGLAKGTSTVTVTTVDGGYTASCVVTVITGQATDMTLNIDRAELRPGNVLILEPIFYPAGADHDPVVWSTSDASVATVYNGVVRAASVGTAIITATCGDLVATCYVLVTSDAIPVERVVLDASAISMYVGESATLTATVLPADATIKDVIWSSGNESVAIVNDGVVTGIAAGKTVITVTTVDGAHTATCSVTVMAPIVHVTGVTLDKTSAEIFVGEKVTLIATVLPADATNKAVIWSSSNASVATVDVNGVFTGISEGTAIITVTTVDGGYKAECAVTVKPIVPPVVHPTGVTLDKTSAEICVNETLALTATVLPADATDKSVTWYTSDASVATVSANGVVTGISKGIATITVATVDGNKTATCVVTVTERLVPVTGITLDTIATTIDVGSTVTLNATIIPADASNKNVIWTSSDPNVATVNKGVVTGVSKGTATIRAASEDNPSVYAECVVTVNEVTPVIHVTGVTLDKTNLQLKVGETATLKATVVPSDASDKKVSWRSSDTKVVIVDSDGKVTAVGKGTAKITVITEDGGKTATCDVTVTDGGSGGGDNNLWLYIGIAAAAIIIIALLAFFLMRRK